MHLLNEQMEIIAVSSYVTININGYMHAHVIYTLFYPVLTSDLCQLGPQLNHGSDTFCVTLHYPIGKARILIRPPS